MKKLLALPLLFLFCAVTLISCSDNDNRNYQYRISVLNLTNNQPISPMAVIVHSNQFNAWENGAAASVALEKLAEAGEPDDLIALADASNDVYYHAALGEQNLQAGNSILLDISFVTHKNNPLMLTIAGKLQNTNDGFAGRTMIDLQQLAFTDHNKASINLFAWDSGTEANTETEATISGPAGTGTGFDASRVGDIDKVSQHIGIIGNQGDKLALTDSVLTSSHKFDNPVARVFITRTN
ncbi:spondin domain-containing protein [Pelagibaculum spongiae]|uniref:Spondin domain-containing protein n=1 Tax=Pelagibaculum spongiae TaxID=2080658 RepID=A0A2V1GVX6_9GAMM|nr:spondin domain-containing protein [Pelagibaculum spongiae]PVZ70180.1 hypothetical protein DC094_06140 [Pelagibaculum spongiae]